MDRLMKFLTDHFNTDEPMARSIGLQYDDEVNSLMKEIYKENISILLISDLTGEIIACRTIAIGKKDEEVDWTKFTNEKLATIFKFISHKKKEMDVFKRFNVNTSINFVQLGTNRNYRHQGIASKMMEVALLFCKELGINPVCVAGEGSTNYSQRIYEKNGFETLHIIYYDEYKENGEVVFKNMAPHKSTKIYVKQL